MPDQTKKTKELSEKQIKNRRARAIQKLFKLSEFRELVEIEQILHAQAVKNMASIDLNEATEGKIMRDYCFWRGKKEAIEKIWLERADYRNHINKENEDE